MVSQVPFSVAGSSVFFLLADFRQRGFSRVDSVIRTWTEGSSKADAAMITPRHQSRTRCRANGTGDLEVGKPHAFGSHLIQVWCREFFGPKWADIRVAHVIDEHHDHIWRIRGRNQRRKIAYEYYGEKSHAFHCSEALERNRHG